MEQFLIMKVGTQEVCTKVYSGGQLKWDGKNVSFCVSTTTEIMKTNNVPLKKPIKLLPEMKKIFLKR